MFLVHIREKKKSRRYVLDMQALLHFAVELQEIGHGGCREEMVRDHAREGEVEGNPRHCRRWPLSASNLPGPL